MFNNCRAKEAMFKKQQSFLTLEPDASTSLKTIQKNQTGLEQKQSGEWFSLGVKYDITVFLSTHIEGDACSECLHKQAGTNTHMHATT